MGFRQPGLDLQTRLFACDLWELQFSFHNPANQDSSSFFFKYLFVYLAALGLSCVMQNLCSVLHHVGTKFSGQGSNPGPPHWECRVSATGPPGKSPPTRILVTVSHVCKGFPHHQSICCSPAGCHVITLNLTLWREHQTPQLKGSVPQDHPPLWASLESPWCHLGF